jgi:hypothetical protein
MSSKDYKGFQKVSSDNHMTVFRHPKGHEVKVAHSALSSKMRKDLEKIPHMAAGGMTEEPSVEALQPQAAPVVSRNIPTQNVPPGFGSNWSDDQKKEVAFNQAIQQKKAETAMSAAQSQAQAATAEQTLARWNSKVAEATKFGVPVPDAPEEVKKAQALISQSQPPAPASVPDPQQAPGTPTGAGGALSSDPYGAQVSADQYMKGLEQEKQGIAQEAQALAAQEKAKSEVEAQKAQTLQNTMQSYEQNHAALQKEREALQADIANSHIDPTRYLDSMSTGKKIRTAIGLMLSGLGAGGSHSEDTAFNFIRSQIDHDIEAQKAEIGKKQNLLSMNMQKFQDLRSATDMTKSMQLDIAAARLSQIAASTSDPVIKAKAMQAVGRLDRESAQVVGQMAARRTMLQGVANGTANPGVVIRSIVPEAHQAAAYKELKEAQDTLKARDNILGAFEQVKKINTLGNSLTSPIQTSRQVNAIIDPLTASLSKETAGRFTEQDAHYLKTLWPAKGDSDETVSRKQNAITHLVSEKMNFPLLDSYGIRPGSQARFDAGGQKKIQLGPPKI